MPYTPAELTSQNFSEQLAPGYRKVFFQWLKEADWIFPTWTNVSNITGRSYVEDHEMGGLGPAVEKEKGGPITMDHMVPGHTKRKTFRTFGNGFGIEMEAYEDGLYDTWTASKIIKELAKSHKWAAEIEAHYPLNNGFQVIPGDDRTFGFDHDGAASPTYQPLFSASHNLMREVGGVSTYSNLVTGDISVLNIQSMILKIRKTPTDEGMPGQFTPHMLLYPPDLTFLVRAILGSEKIPGLNTNDINAIRDFGLIPKDSDWITDVNAYFMFSKEHQVEFIWRKKTMFDNDDDFYTKQALFSAISRMWAGWTKWQGTAGSSGTA